MRRILMAAVGLVVWLNTFDCEGQSLLNNRYNKWYFGYQGGLDFSTSQPTPLTDGQLTTREGASSICDTLGNLLFYTDGVTVYNSSHAIMTNGTGLMGNQTAYQSSVIVPFPNDVTKYYILTTSGATSGGYRYSVVDMTMQFGLGQVTSKNILLDASSTERMIVSHHPNGTDYWLVTHQYQNNIYKVWRISSTGINLNGAYSIGSPFSGAENGGGMKFSHDASTIATPYNISGKTELLGFHKFTGVISGPFNIIQAPAGTRPNAVEFSLNGRFLYITHFRSSPGTATPIIQYDLCSNGSFTLYNSSVYYLTFMSTGPDGKIYISSETQNYSSSPLFSPYGYASVINNPNNFGNSSNFVRDAIYLNGKKIWCVPAVITGNFPASYTANVDLGPDTSICQGGVIMIGPSGQLIPNSTYTWNTGATTPYISVGNPGVYTLTVTSGGCSSTSSIDIAFVNTLLELGADTTLCEGERLVLSPVENLSTTGATYLWNTGATGRSTTVNQAGDYILTRTIGSCVVSDSINVDIFSDSIEIGNNYISFCPGPVAKFAIGVDSSRFPNAAYIWSSGESTPSIITADTGIYSLVVTTKEGCQLSDSARVVQREQVDIDLGPDQQFCKPITLAVENERFYSSYRWSTGSTDTAILVSAPGTYTLTVTDRCGTRVSTITLLQEVSALFPNVITANNDGQNDYFKHGVTEGFLKLRIMNRWGKEVFATDHAYEQWNGGSLPTGLYFYHLERLDCDNLPTSDKGWVQLFR